MVSYLTQRAVAKVAFLILLLVTPFLAFSLFSPLPASGAVWYVSADGGISGDGTTWSTAFISIQQAVSSAREGDEIWVRHGTYPLSSTITVTKAVSLYGGFAGSETQRDQRDWTTNITTIDGQNSTYHCLYVAADATIDGFTITGGNANGETPDHRGGGLYMYYSSPEITNCTVTANSADYGGAVYNRDTSSTITNCIVSGNSAEWGGGIFNGVNSSPTITTCTFTANSATKSGGGVYNDDTSSPTITGCTFTDNEAGYAGGIFNDDDTSSVISRCTFTGNTASTSGGGIYNDDNASATITDCTFTGNSANEDGGGIKTYRASPQITHCTFSGNNAKYGGGMYNCQSSSTITSCIVRANSATASGGGMYNNESYPAITTCTVLNNTAKWGSGIFNDASSPTITACTIYGNSASNYGGAIRNKNASTPTITNSILWANTAPDGPEIYNDDTSTPTTTFCDIEGGYSGEGNINVDPLFVDPTKNDFHLQATSPCIDSGDNTASALPFSDSDGDARIIDGDNDGTATVDIGADEYILLVTADGDLAPLGNRDGIVNVGDALVALRFALLLEIPTQDDITHGDVAPLDAAGLPAPDGAITVGDALVILRMALSLVSLEPIKISGLWALYTTTLGESQEEGPMLIVVLEAGRTVLLEIMALDGTWITGTGTSSGTQIALSWQEADKTVFLTGTLTTDTMSCTWEDSSGDSGTWRAETIIETGDVQVTYPGTGNALIVLEVEGGIGSATLYGTETGQGPALPLTGFTIDTGSGDCVVSLDDQERPLTMTLGTMEVTFTYNQDDSFNYEMKENGVLIYSGAAISTGQEALSGSRSWSVDTAPSSAVRYYSALGLSRTGDLRSGDDKIQFEDLVKNETLATILEMRYGISSTHEFVKKMRNPQLVNLLKIEISHMMINEMLVDTFGHDKAQEFPAFTKFNGFPSKVAGDIMDNEWDEYNGGKYYDFDKDGFSENEGDCNDRNKRIYPGAPEYCNGIDDNCDGLKDINPVDGITYYCDYDGDGFGNPNVTITSCGPPPSSYVNDNTDCDDNDKNKFPGQQWWKDTDNDGYTNWCSFLISCPRPGGYKLVTELTADTTDCDDSNPSRYPGAPEICDDTIDQDCDGNDTPCTCEDGTRGCNGTCIPDDRVCCYGQGYHCPSGNVCLNNNCCPAERACDGITCCDEGRHCCNDGGGHSCPNGTTCCNDIGQCCPPGYHCCPGGLCQIGYECCGDKCCPPELHCVGGECVPK